MGWHLPVFQTYIHLSLCFPRSWQKLTAEVHDQKTKLCPGRGCVTAYSVHVHMCVWVCVWWNFIFSTGQTGVCYMESRKPNFVLFVFQRRPKTDGEDRAGDFRGGRGSTQGQQSSAGANLYLCYNQPTGRISVFPSAEGRLGQLGNIKTFLEKDV